VLNRNVQLVLASAMLILVAVGAVYRSRVM
jgi:hypothetical protein